MVGLIVSTFGEGDPPDNAMELYECLSQWQACKSTRSEPPLAQLRYFALDLGAASTSIITALLILLMSFVLL